MSFEIGKILAIIIIILIIANIIYNKYKEHNIKSQINPNNDLKDINKWRSLRNLNFELKIKNFPDIINLNIINIFNLNELIIYETEKESEEQLLLFNIISDKMKLVGFKVEIKNVNKLNQLSNDDLSQFNINQNTDTIIIEKDNRVFFLSLDKNLIFIEENNKLYVINVFYDIEELTIYNKNDKLNKKEVNDFTKLDFLLKENN